MAEVELRKQRSIRHLDGYEVGRRGLPANLLPEDFPDKVYVTFDVDALDPSIMPSTGTPEPGGLGWFQTLECMEKIIADRTVIGCDFVELAPVEKLHAPDYLVARLIYHFMGLIVRK
jgi:agmatinase